MPDPDLAGVGGGGEAVFTKIFSWPFGPQFALKLRGGGPRDPPMLFDNKTSSMSTLSSMNNHDDGSTEEKTSKKVTLEK